MFLCGMRRTINEGNHLVIDRGYSLDNKVTDRCRIHPDRRIIQPSERSTRSVHRGFNVILRDIIKWNSVVSDCPGLCRESHSCVSQYNYLICRKSLRTSRVSISARNLGSSSSSLVCAACSYIDLISSRSLIRGTLGPSTRRLPQSSCCHLSLPTISSRASR